jgi:mannose-1-phosphate guanylyltransferase
VLFDDAAVGAAAIVRSSVLGVGAVVGAGAVLDRVIVGDGAKVGAANELTAGARVWPDVVLPDRAIRFSSDEPPA